MHAIVAGEDFTDEIQSLLIKYGLNVMIPVYCVEKGHESVAEIEKRNPGFEKRLLAYPRHKIELLRHSIDEASPESLVALGLSFPRMRIRNLRSNNPVDAYYTERQIFEEHLLRSWKKKSNTTFLCCGPVTSIRTSRCWTSVCC